MKRIECGTPTGKRQKPCRQTVIQLDEWKGGAPYPTGHHCLSHDPNISHDYYASGLSRCVCGHAAGSHHPSSGLEPCAYCGCWTHRAGWSAESDLMVSAPSGSLYG